MPDDNNDDDISITSTVSSDHLYEYDVEHILAEREFDGVVRYLVKRLILFFSRHQHACRPLCINTAYKNMRKLKSLQQYTTNI